MNTKKLLILCQVYIDMEKSYTNDIMSPGYVHTTNMLSTKGSVKCFKFREKDDINASLISKLSTAKYVLLILPNSLGLNGQDKYAWNLFDFIEDNISLHIEKLWWWGPSKFKREIKDCYLYYI